MLPRNVATTSFGGAHIPPPTKLKKAFIEGIIYGFVASELHKQKYVGLKAKCIFFHSTKCEKKRM
jgi:hypothetical protein